MLTRTSAAVLGLLLWAAVPGLGFAQNGDITYGWYELGVGLIDDTSLVDFASEPVNDNTVEFNPGFRFGIAFGGEVAEWLALELQSGFHYNSIDSVQGAESSSGNLYQVPLTANVIFRLPNATALVPYAGAGVGAYLEILDGQNLTLGNTRVSGTENAWTFGYQGFAGINYYFREDLSLGASYHYGVADGPSWSLDGGENIKFDAIRNHSFAIVLSYRF